MDENHQRCHKFSRTYCYELKSHYMWGINNWIVSHSGNHLSFRFRAILLFYSLLFFLNVIVVLRMNFTWHQFHEMLLQIADLWRVIKTLQFNINFIVHSANRYLSLAVPPILKTKVWTLLWFRNVFRELYSHKNVKICVCVAFFSISVNELWIFFRKSDSPKFLTQKHRSIELNRYFWKTK